MTAHPRPPITLPQRCEITAARNPRRHPHRWLPVLFLAILLSALTTSLAQVVITSLDRSGKLSWVNSARSNATYRVEWAASVEGPWKGMEALTNLTLISASNALVAVQVPMCYRVVWTDAPAYVGCYRYSGYDDHDSLVVTGRLCLWAQADPANGHAGRWEFARADASTNQIGNQIGSGFLAASISGNRLSLNLNPGWADNNVFLDGQLTNRNFSGVWTWSGFFGPLVTGRFAAQKEP